MTAQNTVDSRLHHNAYVTADMEATRAFYEDVIGYPLIATWCEQAELFGKERTYMHCFFEVGGGECLAFFQFAEKSDQEEFGPSLTSSPFRHIAMKVDHDSQEGIRSRLAEAGYAEPDTYVLDHGYCYSLYATDPNGLIVEFTVDHDDVDTINAERKASAHADLNRWLAGDHTPNNSQFHR